MEMLWTIVSNNDYGIYSGREAMRRYLHQQWSYSRTSFKANIAEMERIREFILNKVIEPQGERASEATIQDIMSIEPIKHIFGGSSDTLAFLLIDHTIDGANAYYRSTAWSNGERQDLILVPHALKDFGCPQANSILHELGHAFHCRLTGNLNVMPSAFVLLQKNLFPGSINAPREHLWEIIADCFATTVSVGTKYKKTDMLVNCGVNANILEAIHAYIFYLIRMCPKSCYSSTFS